MGILGGSLGASGHAEEALPVLGATLAVARRYFSHDSNGVLTAQAEVANCLCTIGREHDAHVIMCEIYNTRKAAKGPMDGQTITAALNYAGCLGASGAHEEALKLLRKTLPDAQRALGESNDCTTRPGGMRIFL